ncbi:uncharacterized protein LOC135833818 [Planococcus citri]|uniref:uncharacterized protein LOC135833818 n=1 Tax=Planococcus citri TaxID=170843 RepID=UPI0031F7EE19
MLLMRRVHVEAVAVALRLATATSSSLKKCRYHSSVNVGLCIRIWLVFLMCSQVDCAQMRHHAAKDNRCHMLKKPGCDVSLYKISDFEEAGWFYHAPFKSCRPFYAAAAAPDSRSLCAQNRDLPLTKEECEELCGEYCKLPDGTLGVCMLEGSCNIEIPTSWNPRPCRAHNVQCCPKIRREAYP